MQCVATFQEFYNLLTETHNQHKRKPAELEEELRKVINKGKEMLQGLQRQDRQNTEEQGLREHSQERSNIDEDRGEQKNTLALEKSERTSLKKVEESEFASKETKVVDKKSVGCQVEAADQSYIRNLEEELLGCRRDLEAKEREIESLMRRLAHYNDMRTRQDQRHVEDTLSLNRQSRVEQDFEAFTSHERIDTCIMIKKGYREKTDINAKRLTSMLFEVVYEYAFATKAAMIDVFKGILKFAADNGPYIRHVYSVQGLQDVKQKIFTGVAQGLPRERSCKLNPSWELLHHLDDYLKACIKLTWRMVTQVPPLRLEYHTFTYKRECHKIAESQDDARDDRYQNHRVYYLWPGLVDGGGRTIIKGEVAIEK